MNEKDNYKERRRFWIDKSLTQTGYSINLFTSLSIAFVGYLVNQKDLLKKIVIDFDLKIDWVLIFFYSSLIFSVLGCMFGVYSVLSRLTDFRITRNIVKAKSKYFDNYNRKAKRIKTTKLKKGFSDFIMISFLYDNDFNLDLIDDIEKFDQRLKLLKERSDFLGKITWRYHKTQIIFIFLAVDFYAISEILNTCI